MEGIGPSKLDEQIGYSTSAKYARIRQSKLPPPMLYCLPMIERSRSPKSKPRGTLLDDAVLNELFDSVADGVPEVMLDLIEAFLDECSSRTLDISLALASEDAQLVEISAHSLKSSAATFGASQLAQGYAEIESLARRGDLERIQTQVRQLAPLYAAVCSEIRNRGEQIRRQCTSEHPTIRSHCDSK